MTDKPTWFHKSILTGILRKSSSCINDMKQAYGVNIHITSDEKFVKDDYITDGIEVIRATPKLVDAQGLVNRRDWKKIILSTDEELIKDGVQAIDDEFLEWFVNNPSCEEVKIIKVPYFDESGHSYLLIIPKEEPKFEESTDTTVDIMLLANSMFGKKEETIEEVAFRLYPIDMRECDNSEDWDINEQYRNEWIAGAKWMKEQYRIKDLRK